MDNTAVQVYSVKAYLCDGLIQKENFYWTKEVALNVIHHLPGVHISRNGNYYIDGYDHCSSVYKTQSETLTITAKPKRNAGLDLRIYIDDAYIQMIKTMPIIGERSSTMQNVVYAPIININHTPKYHSIFEWGLFWDWNEALSYINTIKTFKYHNNKFVDYPIFADNHILGSSTPYWDIVSIQIQ